MADTAIPGTRRSGKTSRALAWLTRSRWSRIDGLVILGLGWLMGSDHRIGSRIALLVTMMFGVSFANDAILAIVARIARLRQNRRPERRRPDLR